MPPRKVYGKSRTNYDPLAVFDSPQRPVAREAEKRLHIERKALQPLNVNRGTHTVFPVACKPVKKEKSRRHVVEDSKDEGQANNVEPASPPLVKPSKPRTVPVEDSEDEQEVSNFTRPRNAIGKPPRPRKIIVEDSEDETENSCRAPEAAERATEATCNPNANLEKDGEIEKAANEYEQHCSELLRLSSHGITTYTDWSNQLSNHFTITKIAEASFSEVYRLSLLEEYSDLFSSDESVFKVIPLRPTEQSTTTPGKGAKASTVKQHESCSAPTDVANEMRLLLRMNEVPGFTNFRDVRIIQGRPPQPFVKAYKDFNALQKRRKKDVSLFPDPSKKSSYPEDQLWAVIEMQDAGTDLEQLVESGECTSMFLVWDIFWQVALSLAKGEEAAQFEHRDLHLGNICVRMSPGELEFDLKCKMNFTGVEATIIDYTISRAIMEDGSVAYHDLATDTAIFEGNSTEEYQYDIYRYMRGLLLFNDPYTNPTNQKQVDDRSWKQYHPISNLIWLHFILHKLLSQVAWPSRRKESPKKAKDEHKKWNRENDLEHVLLQIAKLLEVDKIASSLIECASDLVGLALREAWLDEEDVLGCVTEVEEGLIDGFEELTVSDKS